MSNKLPLRHMIPISASFQRTFIFPAPLSSCFDFHTRFDRVITYLPHISLVKSYNQQRFRVAYDTTEFGAYRVKVFCDIEFRADQENYTLSILPFINGNSPISPSVKLYSLTGQGIYTSHSAFSEEGCQTLINYSLNLESSLPVPRALKLFPESVLSKVASEITQIRIREIAQGYIQRSISVYTSERKQLEARNLVDADNR